MLRLALADRELKFIIYKCQRQWQAVLTSLLMTAVGLILSKATGSAT